MNLAEKLRILSAVLHTVVAAVDVAALLLETLWPGYEADEEEDE